MAKDDQKESKQEANYRRTDSESKNCEHCKMFRHPSSCTKVAGFIRPQDVCDYWEK